MSKKIWRGGMVGAGAWSEVQLTAWAGVENAEIVALTDRHPERRDPVVQRFNIQQAFDDFERMLDEVELDFVDVCVRPYSHAPLTKLAAERGLPVLCQKPFCESLEEAQEVVEFCDQAGGRLMINENWRWQAWYRKAKEMIDSGAIGEPFLGKIFHSSIVSRLGLSLKPAVRKHLRRWRWSTRPIFRRRKAESLIPRIC